VDFLLLQTRSIGLATARCLPLITQPPDAIFLYVV
jgi:hypothetical protein